MFGGIGLSAVAILFVLGAFPSFATDFQATSLDSTVSDDSVLQGHFTYTLRDSEGFVKQTFQTDNLVVNEGMECVGDFVFGTTECTGEAVFQYLAVGTATVAPVDGDTALGTESATCARVQDATPVMNTGTTGQRAITVSSLFSGANCEGEAYGETGLFDALTTGNMLATSLISPTITLGSGDTLTIDYTVTINNT